MTEGQDDFDAHLRAARRAAGLTQAELAGRAGCSLDTVKKLETGARRPSPELSGRLAGALGLAGAALLGGPAPSPPSPAEPLIGREGELEALLGWLRAPRPRLVTVVGPGGVGKTSLALAAADAAGALFPGGVAVAPLAPLARPEEVPLALAESLGVALVGARAPEEQLAEALAGRAALLVLDNCEHLLGEGGAPLPALVARVLAAGARVLATSRERLRLREEQVLELGGLPAAGGGPAVQLFVERAQRLHPGFSPRGAAADAVARICRAVGGLPLAIELAAGWVRALAPAELAEELGRSLDLLASDEPDRPARHRSVRAVLDHSWALLGDEERRALARMSVFGGGFDRAAAEAVAGTGPRLLAALIDRSLLRREEQRGQTRYELHALLRQYAAERLADDPAARADSEARHAAHYAERLRQLAAPEARRELARELDNVRAAWARAAESGDAAAVAAMLGPLGRVYEQRGWLHDGAALFGAAAEALGRAAPAERALLGRLRSLQGYFLVRAGRIAPGRAALEAALEAIRESGAAAPPAQLTYHLGVVAMRQGRLDEAQAWLEQAAGAAASEADAAVGLMAALFRSGLAKVRSDWDTSGALLGPALAESRRLGLRRIEALCQVQLAELALYRGDLAGSDLHVQEATRLAGLAQDMWAMSMALGTLAYTTIVRGQRGEARYMLAEALAGLRAAGDTWLEGRLLRYQVALDLGDGDQDSAARACAALIRIAAAGEALLVPIAAVCAAELLAARGADAEALAALLAADGLPGHPEAQIWGAPLRTALESRLGPDQRAEAARVAAALPPIDLAESLLARRHAGAPAPAPRPALGGLALPATGEALSPREVEVLRLLAGGASNQAIAEALTISRHTAKHHVTSILAKLGVATRTDAALAARDLGLGQ